MIRRLLEETAKRINWIKNFSKVKDISFDKSDLYIKWFEDGTLNVSANCIDRHLKIIAIKLPCYGKETI